MKLLGKKMKKKRATEFSLTITWIRKTNANLATSQFIE